MIRISTDCDGGGWWFISDKERGQVNESGQGDKYRSAFDGLIGWADIIGVKGQTIMDPDFVQLNTLASDAEREFHISMLLVSGSQLVSPINIIRLVIAPNSTKTQRCWN